jgi:hypothetical protein
MMSHMNMELVSDMSIHQGIFLAVPVLTDEGTVWRHSLQQPQTMEIQSFKTDKNSILAQLICGDFIYMATMKASYH